MALRITGSPDLAEDVLQEAFLQIWSSAVHYRPDLGRPMTWITAIVRHRAMDRRKHERRRGRVIDDRVKLEALQLASPERDPLSHFHVQEAGSRLIECLERLSASQQRAVLLAYYYGHTREEVAAALGAAVGTVKSWLHRGLKRLQQCLSP